MSDGYKTLKTANPNKPWIACDLDRTLAHYTNWATNGAAIGAPIPAMVERVKRWRASGIEVRIFTARAHPSNPRMREDEAKIHEWCAKHLGAVLTVTCEKDFNCIALWDDLAITVEPNTGWRWTALMEGDTREPLSFEDEARLTGYITEAPLDESKLTDEDTKGMMIKLAEARGMVSQYSPDFVNPPKIVKD